MSAVDVAFSPEKFEALAVYMYREVVRRGGPMCADKLACMMFLADFDAFGRLGEPLTGATWCKGLVVPYPRELGESWLGGRVLAELTWHRAFDEGRAA